MSRENETFKIASNNQLIDMPIQGTAFNNKTKTDAIAHPKAVIKPLTFSYPRNGLANLL